jgi:hypothetical protein
VIEQSIYAIAAAHGGLTALVGTRVFPEAEEQEHVTPRLVFGVVDWTTVSGVVQDSAWRHTWIEFTCWGASAIEAKQVREQVYAAYARYFGTIGGHSIDPVGSMVEHGGESGYDPDLQQYYELVLIKFFHN